MDSEEESASEEEVVESEEESDSSIASLSLATTYVAKSIFKTEDNDSVTNTNDENDSAPTYCFMACGAKALTSRASEWIMDSGCTNHMTGDRSLLMDSTLRPSDKSHITFADTGKARYWV